MRTPHPADPATPAPPLQWKAAPGLGLDLVRIPRVEEMLARWGDAFRRRCFTPGEIAYCEARPKRRAVHYAGRLAAKEACAKALGTGFARGVGWRLIEVTRAEGGPPRLVLHGAAAAAARTIGCSRSMLTITHDGDLAAAVVFLHTSEEALPVENPR